MTELKKLWDQFGEKIFSDPIYTKRLTPEWFNLYLERFIDQIQYCGVGLGIPCKREVVQETLATAMMLTGNKGILGMSNHGFEVAANREGLVNFFIEKGFSRMLFLDSDTVIDEPGLKQLMDSMDATGAAVMSALVKIRETNGEYNACIGHEDDGRHIKVTTENMGETGAPFPVEHGCLAVALLDLEQIKKHPGPRFQRVFDGRKHLGEDQLFCRWIQKNSLELWVDPKVQTVHVVPMYLGHRWPQTTGASREVGDEE